MEFLIPTKSSLEYAPIFHNDSVSDGREETRKNMMLVAFHHQRNFT